MNKNPIIVLLLIVIVILSYMVLKDEIKIAKISNSPAQEDNQIIKGTLEKGTESNGQITLYLEKETDPMKFPTGSSGQPYRIMATSTVETTITYTVTGNNSAVVPNPVNKDFNYSQTVSVPVGTTQIGTVSSTDKPTLKYTIN